MDDDSDGGFGVSVNTTWNQSGTLTVEALKPNGNVAETCTESVSVLPTIIGGISIEGPTTVSTDYDLSYLAATTVAGNSLSNINWTVPPGAQVFGGNNGLDIAMAFSSPGTYELGVTATVTENCNGGSATRGNGITITVTNNYDFGSDDDYLSQVLDRKKPNPDDLNLAVQRDFDEEIKTAVLFPNPVSAGQLVQYQLQENIDLTEQLFIHVFDTQGRLVQKIQLQDQVTSIATDQLASGIYYLQIQSKNYSDTQTIMVE